ncbi:MAG: sulfite exporter TauE/SafE family protein [Candidatus Hydrogenedentales bacterium]|jgi:hypothetical protein
MFQSFITPGIPWAVFWLFVAVAIVIQGISKSGFAGGAGILSLPLMMLVMPVDKVSATLLPLLILCDFNAIYHHRHNKAWDKILAVYIPSIFGIVIGAYVWWRIGKAGINTYGVYIKQFVGVIGIVFSAYIILRESAQTWVAQYKPGPIAAWTAGISAGFCSTIAHAAGPIVGLFLFAQGMGKSLFVGTTAWTFTLINLTKLPFYFAVGLIHNDVLLFDLMLVPLIPIGSALGKWMHHRISETLFNRVILVLTVLAAIQLLADKNVILIALQAVFPAPK